MTNKEILRISKQYADLMFAAEKSTILAKQQIERMKAKK